MLSEKFMCHALHLAKKAAKADEVPIGAIVVYKNEIIGEGWNQSISSCDPTAHAEILALRQAAQKIGNYRLLDTTLYVTLEPCAMCVGAIIHARVKQLVFAAWDPKAGAVRGAFDLIDDKHFNHRVSWKEGILAEPCQAILQDFFQKKR